ncbi:MAG: thioredoxin [Alphaproteobacteria bacterium]|nr:MAG: thioredoxin [Alphaproteobacteria bacterium]
MEIDLTGGMAGNGAVGAQDLIKESSTATFVADVVEASQDVPVIVDFWAPWCGPCKQLTPLLESAVRQAQGMVKMVKINIDDNPEIAQQLRVQSIPAVFAFRNGQPVDGFMGVQPESQVKSFVQRLTGAQGPSPVEQALEHGKAALEATDFGTAAQAFSQAIEADPANIQAIAGLAKCFLADNNLERAQQVLDTAPAGAHHADLDSARATLELARQAAEAGDVASLKAKVAADPKDFQARFDLAVALNVDGDRQGAVDQLLDIIAADREWNEQAARNQLLKFFEAYGSQDEITQTGRRRLSSILFS